MIVEDDVDDRLYFSDAVKGNQRVQWVHWAWNGAQALKTIAQSKKLPDFIFIDINSDEPGTELFRN
jgi:CheY-like chemotaxis protein